MTAARAKTLIALLLAVWAGLFVWSFIAYSVVEPEGSGFTRGLNRITGFLGWQLAAGLAAIPLFVIGRSRERGAAMRWLSRVPLAIAVALGLAIIGLLAWVSLIKG